MDRTIRATLPPTPALSRTIREFNGCCNFFLRLGLENHTSSKLKLQKLGYAEARRRWPALQSSLVQGARDCAADMLKREKCARLSVKADTSSARFNQRTFKAYLKSGLLSIATVEGRRKVLVRIPEYFGKYLHGRVKSLRVREHRGRLLADLVVELPEVPLSARDPPVVLGMDRGIVNAAVTSDGGFFDSRAINRVRGRYRHLRRRLQAAGTRSAKRHLTRLSGRERRFQADVNHRIAKAVAAKDFDVLALEDLHIEKTKENGRQFNRKLGGWAFAQLEAFLVYKLGQVGKRIVRVPPEYTSKLCSRCGLLGIRSGSSFRCQSCGHSLNADLNGARNIAHLGSALVGRPTVNRPIVADGEAGHRNLVEFSYKPLVSTCGG